MDGRVVPPMTYIDGTWILEEHKNTVFSPLYPIKVSAVPT